MSASLSPAQVAQYRRDGFLFPIDCLTPDEVRHYRASPRRLRARTGRHVRQTARSGALEVASAVHLDGRTRAPSEGAGRGGKHHRPEHPDLSPDLLAEGTERAIARLMASGRHVFRTGSGRAGHRLDRADRLNTGDGLRQDHPGQPRDRPAAAQRHVLARQPAVARPDHRAQARLHELRDDAAAGRPDLAAPHPHRALVRAEPNDQRRIGIGVSYIPPHCRLVNDARVTAALVRGRDDYGHFDPEPRPTGDFDAGSRAAHAAAVEQFFESNKLLAARRRSGNVGI